MSPPSSPTTPTPYYTVVGSSADRVVAADGPEDHNWTNYAGTYYWSYATASASTSAPKTPKSGGGLVGLGKSLTRKVSNRWRKAGGVVMTEGRGQDDSSSLGSSGIKSAEPATPAAQDSQGFSRRSGSAGPEEPTKSPLQVGKERIRKMRSRYSISISVDPKSADGKNLASPSPATPTPDTPTSIDSVRVPRRLVKPRPSHSSADPSPSRAPSESTPSSVSRSISTPISEKASSAKLWKLMKRISTGGLRDKYHSRSSSKSHLPNYSEESLSHTSSFAHEPAPPVPALPKGFRSFFPVGSSPTSPISVSSDGGHSPRTSSIPNTGSDVQIHISQTRTVESHRSASLHAPIPIPSSSSSPAGNQKKMLHRLRATSSVGALRRRTSTSSGFSASASASVSEQGLIRSSTPSGQARPQIPSRPSTANAAPSSPDPRFLNTSVIGRSRSMRSKRSSISSVDEVNGHSPPPQNELNHSPPPQQQQQSNNKHNSNNGMVLVPPIPTNILAKHIVPPAELSKGPGHVSSTSLTTTSSANKDIEPETRNNEKEGSLTGVSTGPTQSGSGNHNARRTVDKGYPPPHISGFSRGRPSKVGLYLELPSRSATSPLPRININDLDNKSGSIRIPVPMPSPGRSASLGGFEWSMARSPENELPSLPVPPRKRVAERGSGESYVGGGGVDVSGSENVLLLGRGRSSTTSAISPLSSPTSRVFSTSSPPRAVESPSSLSSSGAGSAEYFTPALSTFGRVVGKQFGMERIEEPSFASTSTPGSASSVNSSFGSGSGSAVAGSSSSIGWKKRNRRMSISESISHFLSVSSSSPRPGRSESSSAVGRSYSSPSPCFEAPLSSSSQSQPSLPLSSSSQPVVPPPPSTSSTSTFSSTPAGTLSTLLRKLSFSSGASTLPPVRPARNPRRPSASTVVRDVKKEENSNAKTNNTGGAKVLRKSSLKRTASVKSTSNGSTPTNGAVRNGDAEDHSNHHPYAHHRKSISLTEKEKRERWKDLLMRSEKAGGTLHLNADGEGLLSDRMSTRASAVSLVMGELEFEEQAAAAAALEA